jgi:mannosyl-3-phosphoglycerate phosphatase
MKRRSLRNKIVVFTDLDATLLDGATYSWQAARTALEALRKEKAGLVLVSSKTFGEMAPFHSEFGFDDPFTVENGGGIVFSDDAAVGRQLIDCLPEVNPIPKGRFLLFPLGTPYQELVRNLYDISLEIGVELAGFNSMSVAEIASLTGLSVQEAARARIRDFDEPFLLPQEAKPKAGALVLAAAKRGLTAVAGGRFWHLIGHSGKGRAVSILMEAYERLYGRTLTVGLGDSPNDFAFLELVDVPVIVGPSHQSIVLPESICSARQTGKPGPIGWNEAILEILSEEREEKS